MKIRARQLTTTDIKGLEDFLITLNLKIKQYNLDQIFDIKKQLVGPIGEAYVLIKLYRTLGEKKKYVWYGSR